MSGRNLFYGVYGHDARTAVAMSAEEYEMFAISTTQAYRATLKGVADETEALRRVRMTDECKEVPAPLWVLALKTKGK